MKSNRNGNQQRVFTAKHGLGAHRKNCLSQPVHSRLYTKAVKLKPITFHHSSDTSANLTKPAPKGIK